MAPNPRLLIHIRHCHRVHYPPISLLYRLIHHCKPITNSLSRLPVSPKTRIKKNSISIESKLKSMIYFNAINSFHPLHTFICTLIQDSICLCSVCVCVRSTLIQRSSVTATAFAEILDTMRKMTTAFNGGERK